MMTGDPTLKFHFGLRGRLILLVCIAVLPIVGALAFMLDRIQKTMSDDARHELFLSAQLLSRNIEQLIESSRALLAAGAVNESVMGLSPAACSKHVREIVRRNPAYLDLGLVGGVGRLVCTASGRLMGTFVGDRDYIRAVFRSGRFSMSGFQIGRVSGKPALAMGYPIGEQGRPPRGVLVLSLDLSQLNRMISTTDFHPGSTLTLVDSRGVVLARVPEGPRWVGKDAGGLAIVKQAMRERTGTAFGEGLDGVRRIFAFVPLHGSAEPSGLTVFLGAPEGVAFGAMRRWLLVAVFSSSLALLLGAVLTALYGKRSILRPLAVIGEAARRLGEGDLSARTGLKGRDEIGVLGLIFDRTAASLEELTRQNRLILENAGEGICFTGPEGNIAFANPAAERMLGYEAGEMTGRKLHALVHHSREDGSPLPEEECALHDLLATGGGPYSGESVFWRKDGKSFPVAYSYAPVREKGWLSGAVAVFRDLTERNQLERRLLQSQKLEAMGRLAGGVAHDFNNLLTAILGFSGFLKESLAAEDERRGDVDEIVKAAQRAANLTRQLLLFSRNKPADLKALSLSELVADQLKLLRRVVGEGVEIREKLQPELGRVLADPGQLEQIVLNLVVNARDAMPQGGVIELETADSELPEDAEGMMVKGEAGPQVRLTVRDNGAGMEAGVIDRLFEPFFTTKEPGKGTGLGLAIVYGVLRRCKGSIRVRSSPGKGSELALYFPREQSAAAAAAPSAQAAPRPGTETILIVENEDAIRRMIRRVLEKGGYRVMDAPGLEKALALARKAAHPPDLLLSDVVLLGARGPDVARKLRERLPELKVLYMTGFPGEQSDLPQDPRFILHKPFTPRQLLERVRLVLDD
ncbi:MAG: ATP-binding protein [Elusimicrobiota bacterium]